MNRIHLFHPVTAIIFYFILFYLVTQNGSRKSGERLKRSHVSAVATHISYFSLKDGVTDTAIYRVMTLTRKTIEYTAHHPTLDFGWEIVGHEFMAFIDDNRSVKRKQKSITFWKSDVESLLYSCVNLAYAEACMEVLTSLRNYS